MVDRLYLAVLCLFLSRNRVWFRMHEGILKIDHYGEHQLLRVRVLVPYELIRLIGFHQGRTLCALRHFSCLRLAITFRVAEVGLSGLECRCICIWDVPRHSVDTSNR